LSCTIGENGHPADKTMSFISSTYRIFAST
jgi:hypothetical protein